MAEKDPFDERRQILSYENLIPWDSYVGAGKSRSGETVFLDANDVKLIKRFAKESPDAMTELLESDADAALYPQALMKILINITDVRVLQYALTLIQNFLEVDTTRRARFFVKPTPATAAASGSKHIYFTPFLQLVGTTGTGAVVPSLDANTYVLEHAANSLSMLVSVDDSDHHVVGTFLAWIITHIKNFGVPPPKQAKVTEIAVQALKHVLQNDRLREFFVGENGIGRLLPLLNARNTQLLYDVVFCLWSLSLRKQYTRALLTSGAVAAIARLARPNMPLKLNRVAFGMLANVVRDPTCVDALVEICETTLPTSIDTLLAQDPKIADSELLEDLTFLQEAVRSNRRRFTSLERYEKDVDAKKFEWTMVHTSDFWKENAVKFEADGFKLIERVRDLLRDKDVSPQTLAVALFDLGEFAVQHPQGRTILQALKVRDVVMELLKHEDEEVRQQALLSCSKLLVARWEFVGASAASKK